MEYCTNRKRDGKIINSDNILCSKREINLKFIYMTLISISTESQCINQFTRRSERKILFLTAYFFSARMFYRTSSGLTVFESSKNRCGSRESLVTFLISWLSIIRGCLRLLLLLLLKATNLSEKQKDHCN